MKIKTQNGSPVRLHGLAMFIIQLMGLAEEIREIRRIRISTVQVIQCRQHVVVRPRISTSNLAFVSFGDIRSFIDSSGCRAANSCQGEQPTGYTIGIFRCDFEWHVRVRTKAKVLVRPHH